MSIAKRLAAGFLIVLAIALLIGWVGLSRMRELHETTNRLAGSRFERVELAQRGLAMINENSRVALHLFVVGDPAELDREIASQAERSRRISALYDELGKKLDSRQERRLFEAIKNARAGYVGRRADAEQLLRGGQRAAALAMFDKDVVPRLEDYITSWNDLVVHEANVMDEEAAAAATTYENARAATIALLAIAIALGALAAFVVTRQITRPVKAIAAAVEELEKGDLKARAPVERDDEVGKLARAFNVMGEALAQRIRQERLEREMKLAQSMQTGILPRKLTVAALDVSAGMVPATEIGGDYYDVLPAGDGCWLGIGDVAGHGLDAGLVTLMIQSSVATLVRDDPGASPREIVSTVNAVLYENLNERLCKTSHATMVLLRIGADGHVTFAGAHEELLVWRSAARRCEIVETPGTWIGAVGNVAAAMIDSTIDLRQGDLLVLFTDGLTEARDAKGASFGLERLRDEVERLADEPVETIREKLLDVTRSWVPGDLEDDLSVVVARYTGASRGSMAGVEA